MHGSSSVGAQAESVSDVFGHQLRQGKDFKPKFIIIDSLYVLEDTWNFKVSPNVHLL